MSRPLADRSWINKEKPRVELTPIAQEQIQTVTSFSVKAAVQASNVRHAGILHPMTITVATGNAPRAGTDAEIAIVIIGDTAITQQLRLKSKGGKDFQRGQVGAASVQPEVFWCHWTLVSIVIALNERQC